MNKQSVAAIVLTLPLLMIAANGCAGADAPADVPVDGSGGESSGGGGQNGGDPATGGAAGAGASGQGSAGGARTGGGPGTSTGGSAGPVQPDPADPLCGNGVIDAGEECDDGNQNGRDDCTVFCRMPRLALGRDHSCAIAGDGTLLCWGRGEHGQLGDGMAYSSPPSGVAQPLRTATLTNVRSVSAGQYHTCAVVADAVSCWGAGQYGQLGDGVLHTTDGGRLAPGPAFLSGIARVSADGADHTCAVMIDGTVKCWGFNLFGELGNGLTVNSPSPSTVAGVSDVLQVATGDFRTCALSKGGTVSCWGEGGANPATGSGVKHLTAVTIQGLTNVVELSSGAAFTCALLQDRTVKCWGEGDLGQLGNGNLAAPKDFTTANDTNDTPVTVSGLTDVVQITAGRYHVCALRVDHSVLCWGAGDSGQLGDGVFHNGFPNFVTVPVTATVFRDVVEIAGGGAHTCVLQRDRKVVCVGGGAYGQLGDGRFHALRDPGSKDPVVAAQL